ncbi:MAG TPA: endolytic transglycosylase MltG [Candidatus Scybalocola faecigallinarum]|uniref:Endolytic transglycosylase MltG n=1 Tax=Candidatus Scybalocola faecigallinarum TaxID=2840941 RepID=A0A9D1JRI8_9FIRM|nr:endolytic transglycosylase MltG [Candidatus Scybalocola faecigallinarum]
MRKILLGFFELCIHIVIYALVIFLVYRAAVFAYDFSYNVFGDPVMSKYDTQTVTVVVDDGDSASTVASKLKDAGLIKYEAAFVIRVRLEEMGDKIMPGTFELSPSMSVEEILQILATEGEIRQEESGVITR